MKKILNSIISFISIMLCFLILGCENQQKEEINNAINMNKEIRLGVVPLPHYADLWIAYKKGFLEEELQKKGYTLKWKTIPLGPVVSEAFAADEIDLGVMGDFPAFIGKGNGIDYKIIGIASTAPKALALVVKKESDINNISDLKGKKIATTKAAYGQKLLTLLINNAGMQMDDIDFISMSMEDLSPALLNGDIDAGVIWDPLLTKLYTAGDIKIIADGTDVYDAYSVLISKDNIINNDFGAVQALIEAKKKGIEYMKTHPDESENLLLDEFKLPKNELDIMLKKFNYTPDITEKFIQDMKETEIFMNENKLLRNRVDINEFIVKD